jgi:hypothetical protein
MENVSHNYNYQHFLSATESFFIMPSLTWMYVEFYHGWSHQTPSQLWRNSSLSYFCEDVCNLLMCRKALHVYGFPLHHISNIRILPLIMFRYIRKHWVLKDLYTWLLVIIIGSISWLSTLEAHLRPYPTMPRIYLNTCFVDF